MDIELQNRINDAVIALGQLSAQPIDFSQMDPVAKMMLVALVCETQKIQDYADSATERIVDRFCVDFIPRQNVEATPALCIIRPDIKPRTDNTLATTGSGDIYSYKIQNAKTPLNFIPIFNTTLLPHDGLYLLNRHVLRHDDDIVTISMERDNCLWLGIKSAAEVDCLKGLSLLIRGTNGVMPEHICVGTNGQELDFSTMQEMENIEMAEPFDAQQASGQFFSIIENWKVNLLNIDNAALLYITDDTVDRDIFKPRQYPRSFQQWLESEVLDYFQPSTIWLRLDFPEGFVVPDNCNVILNSFPVTNIDISSLMLTQAQPIAKLQSADNAFFLRILETSTSSHSQGFNMTGDDIIVRDFDARSYNDGDLYRDVRHLYNRFIDDYYAFIEYNGIKDGEVLRQLRETINKLGKSVGGQNDSFKFDSGTYVMKNMSQYPPTLSTRVSYITTMGRIGNTPRAGEAVENRKNPALEQKAAVIVSAMGGTDKATADERYELLRYYALTNDRLYTRMDIDAFLRKELLAEFGKEEFRRIFVKMSIEGTGGADFLQRGLYIDIEFKDRKNFEHAQLINYDHLLCQRIRNKSCIAMPIHVQLKNLEE